VGKASLTFSLSATTNLPKGVFFTSSSSSSSSLPLSSCLSASPAFLVSAASAGPPVLLVEIDALGPTTLFGSCALVGSCPATDEAAPTADEDATPITVAAKITACTAVAAGSGSQHWALQLSEEEPPPLSSHFSLARSALILQRSLQTIPLHFWYVMFAGLTTAPIAYECCSGLSVCSCPRRNVFLLRLLNLRSAVMLTTVFVSQ